MKISEEFKKKVDDATVEFAQEHGFNAVVLVGMTREGIVTGISSDGALSKEMIVAAVEFTAKKFLDEPENDEVIFKTLN